MDSSHDRPPFPSFDVSPWPFFGGGAALLTALGLVLLMHNKGGELLLLGGGFLGWTAWGWWRDMLRESPSDQTAELVERVLRKGVVLFIVSEILFFGAFFWAFFNARLFPLSPEIPWPPQGIRPLDPFQWPYLNTLILLLSGTTLTWAYQSFLQGNRSSLLQGISITVVLGLLFMGIQVYEYHHTSFGFREGIYPSLFYMATGFHGLHVLIGTVFLIVCLARAIRGTLDPRYPVGFEAACWYWQFVDVVWLFLFVAVYWWGGCSH